MAAGPTRWGQHARRRAGLTVHSWHEGEATLSAKQECKVARLFVRTMDRAAGRTTRAKAPRRPPLAQRAERPGRQIRPDPARDRRECCGCAADLHLICCSPLRPATPRHAPLRPAHLAHLAPPLCQRRRNTASWSRCCCFSSSRGRTSCRPSLSPSTPRSSRTMPSSWPHAKVRAGARPPPPCTRRYALSRG